MGGMTFEQRMAAEVEKQLNSGMVERLIAGKLENVISESLNDVFGYGGDGKKAIDEKVREIMIPVIERHDFNRYIVKLDDCLSEIVNSTSLMENGKILENFKNLMMEPDSREIRLSVIFERYRRHVSENVSTRHLEADICDGEPYYRNVDVRMEVECEGDDRSPSHEHCVVKLTCEQDEDMNCQIRLYKPVAADRWNISGRAGEMDILSLRTVSDFEIFLSKINRAYVEIEIDSKSEGESVEVEEKPEYGLV